MLVAVSIASVILLMVYTAYSSIIKTVKYGNSVSAYYQQLNATLDRINADLTHIYWKEGIQDLQLVSIFNGNSSIINFVTAEHKDNRILLAGDSQNPVCDIHETGYYIKSSTDTKSGVLVRKTDILYNGTVSEGGFEEELLGQVVSLKFEFQYRGDWSDNWDTTEKKRLPRAIKTTIELLDPFKNIEKYQIISLPGLAYE